MITDTPILPCLRCHGEAKLQEVKWDNWVECTLCHWKGANMDTMEEAINKWNIANVKDYCPHCESPYSDERDENGLPFCTCDGAEMVKLTRENAQLRTEIAILQTKVARQARTIEMMIAHVPAYLIPTLIAREDAES